MKKLILLLVVLTAFFSCGGGSDSTVEENTATETPEEVVVEENLNPTYPAAVIYEGKYCFEYNDAMKLTEQLKIGTSIVVEGAKVKGLAAKYADTNFNVVREDADGNEINQLTWEWAAVANSTPAVVVSADFLYSEADRDAITDLEVYPMQIVAVHQEPGSKKGNYVKVSYFTYFNDNIQNSSDAYVLGEMQIKQGALRTDKWIDKGILSDDPKDLKAARTLFNFMQYDLEKEADVRKAQRVLEGALKDESNFQDEIEKRIKMLKGEDEPVIMGGPVDEEPTDEDYAEESDADTVTITALTPAFSEPSSDSDMVTSFKEGDVLMYVETLSPGGDDSFVKVTDGEEYFYVNLEDTSLVAQ